MRFSLLIAAMLAVMPSYGVAVAQPDRTSANYWMQGCRDAAALINFSIDGESKEDLLKRGFCVGVIDGLSYLGTSSGVCVPVGVTAEQAARVVVQYIDGQPARMNEDFRLLVLEALRAAWLCKN